MDLRSLNIKKTYETEEDNNHLIDEFYIPALENSNLYLRIAGFFSSTSLCIASKGIAGLIHNNGNMRLLISPELNEDDRAIIMECDKLRPDDVLFDDFKIDDFSDNEYLQALAWMLANKKLEMKIVIPTRTSRSLFHEKIGIFMDDKNQMIAFSGSINETASAWINNIEEFKTFNSWIPEQSEYLLSDLKKFNDYWNGRKDQVAKVYDVPTPILDKIISKKPRDVFDLNIMKKYIKNKKNENNKLSLFPHQEKAVAMWLNNDKKLTMEMATGSGKTRTAIGCMMEQLKCKEKLMIIVSTPQNTLSRQWKDDIDKLQIVFDRNIIVDGSNKKWKKDLEMAFLDLNLNTIENGIIFTTHSLCYTDEFVSIVERSKMSSKIMFVCDEAHGMGATKLRRGLLDIYEYRVGLSATPDRLWDDVGTKIVLDYFGNKKFTFSIYDALNTMNPFTGKPFLNRFNYMPIFVSLSEDETKRYRYFSKMIAIEQTKEEPDFDKIEKLKINRSNVTKNAISKYSSYEQILDELGMFDSISDSITFVSPEQLENVMEICAKKQITRAKITQDESASKIVGTQGNTERQEIIYQFTKKTIQMLIGIDCLNEGIDIPTARIAVLLCNSTNPREYVQRIGRVIRYSPNKAKSLIYDFIVLTDDENLNRKEANRAMYIAQNADNYNTVVRKFDEMGVDVHAY